jgi:hypothetical protein
MTSAFDPFLASEELSMEFPTMDALKKYLHLHPKADPANHSVKEKDEKGGGGKGDGGAAGPKLKERKEEVESFMDTWEKAEQFAGHKIPKPDKLKDIGEKVDEEVKSGKPRSDEEAEKDSKAMWDLLNKEVGKAVDETGKEWNWPAGVQKHLPKQEEFRGLTARTSSQRIVARFLARTR